MEAQKECLNFAIIGAGSRGNAYATALRQCISTCSIRIAAIAEPIVSKRSAFIERHIFNDEQSCTPFDGWRELIEHQKRQAARSLYSSGDRVGTPALDGVFVCTLDDTHKDIIKALAPLHLHIMSEKPLATKLNDCIEIRHCLQPPGIDAPHALFSVGHVLRYSPHNMLLRNLLLKDEVIGDVLSIEHTEPVGWWHFSHSYVRGNWRKKSKTAPSLLTKSCHDIDFLLWLLSSPSEPLAGNLPHHASEVTSSGSLLSFNKFRKPVAAGGATNCMTCPAERDCLYSANKIYVEGHLNREIGAWPLNIIDPEIEDLMQSRKLGAKEKAKQILLGRLTENYDDDTPQAHIDSRSWYGRCVYEAQNTVCDDQVVTMTWKNEPHDLSPMYDTLEKRMKGRGAKIATFHMVASTEKQCERRGRIYGTKGEIEYDSRTIKVYDFAAPREAKEYRPDQAVGGHGGGDAGLAQQFVTAIEAVKTNNCNVKEAQQRYIGCTLDDVIRSHAMVFAAEEAREKKKVINWKDWWRMNVEEAVVILAQEADSNGDSSLP